MRVHQLEVQPNMPEELAPLAEIAHNLWYSWNRDAVELFVRLDRGAFERSGRNAVAMLGNLPQAVLDAAARDESFLAETQRIHDRLVAYCAGSGWYQEAYPGVKGVEIAYFSLEFGLDEALPIYSGGLGVLAGDHLKSASDLGLPLVGVGLLYAQGYFRQALSLDGWQQESYPRSEWFTRPVRQEHGPDGEPLVIEVEMAGERVRAALWRAQVGRVPLFLLDTDMVGNSPPARGITSTLYGGDRDLRIRQELLLAFGGLRALEAAGRSPSVFHMNEGHSAFLALERIRVLMSRHGLSFAEAREQVVASTVFTTHTPVAAGNEVFELELLARYLEPLAAELGLSWDEFAALGATPGEDEDTFGMTPLALRTAAFANGVSRLHGATAREMWKDLWPGLPAEEVPITSVTNGIHTRTWLSREMAAMIERYVGPRFTEQPHDHTLWDRIEDIPPGELWRAKQRRRERLVVVARERLRHQLERRGARRAALVDAEEALRPDILTIGFARRFATYKRATLLLRQPERLVRLLSDPERPIQMIFSGKAHPADTPGKDLIREIVRFAQDPGVRNRVIFLEDYDINVARNLVGGCDVWLNAPRRPLEASGTSGMKAAVNGTINLSVLDGWWDEGYAPELGWAIGLGEEYADPEEQDQIESEALFTLLEQEVIPLFYQRDRNGIPRGWVSMMKASMARLGAEFNTHRMVQEYAERAYLPAHRAAARLARERYAGARDLAAWRERVGEAWDAVRLRSSVAPPSDLRVGASVPVTVWAKLGALSPEEVAVEVAYGPPNGTGEPSHAGLILATHAGRDGDEERFEAEVPCRTSGRLACAVRVRPRNPDAVNPLTPLLLTWE
jgi:glycogen phosphorylase